MMDLHSNKEYVKVELTQEVRSICQCRVILTTSLLFCFLVFAEGQMYRSTEAKIDFISNAPLEIISAQSNEMQGLLDVSKKRFAFRIYIKTFEGFNSKLQQNHFFENYMETDEFPLSTFSGKIIEDIQNGENEYRAKGILEIHGIKKEVIIPVTIHVLEAKIEFESKFKVRLEDYEIKIPKLVTQKIAEVIDVNVAGELKIRE